VPELVASTVWWISAPLVLALDSRLGAPVDSYVNGSQVWLTGDGPGGVMLEWRLHPVSGYRNPKGLAHDDLWEHVVATLSERPDAADALRLGRETRPLTGVWEGLECFCAYGDDVEPRPLSQAVQSTIGVVPDYFGLVDHDAIGAEFERRGGGVSLIAMLVEQLRR
jgi:hypothetical protein